MQGEGRAWVRAVRALAGPALFWLQPAWVLGLLQLKLTVHKWFEWNGRRLRYLFHSYNNMRLTERCVELPIALEVVERERPERLLEIGNVTNYYYDDHWRRVLRHKTVVDRGESGYGVTTADIGEWTPDAPFDMAVSISTFEHMDSDAGANPDWNPEEPLRCAANARRVVREMLRPGACLLITVPSGWAPEVDRWLLEEDLEIPGATLRRWALRRRGALVWREVPWERLRNAPYDRRRRRARAVAVLEWRRDPEPTTD